jgi:glycosyltransferase involved in cell wall biosynthesis
MPELTVSVILPVRNGERYIREAIDSVLAQDSPVHELIVTDDGSTDGTPAVLESYGSRIKVITQAPASQAIAMNAGITAATGVLLSFQDADDVWTPGRMTAMLAALGEDDDAVYGKVEQFVSPDLGPAHAGRLRVDTTPQIAYLLQTLLVRRKAFDSVGMLDDKLTSGANIDWISRSRLVGLSAAASSFVVTRRRIHEHNLGRTMGAEKNANLVAIMRSHLNRHRDEGVRPARPDAGGDDE